MIIRHRRFTFLETVAIVIVISIMTAISLRFIGGANDQVLPAETATLKSHLRFAQTRAMAGTSSTWGVLIQTDRYALYRDGALATASWPGTSSPEYLLAQPVSVTTGTGMLTFDSWGSAGGSDLTITLSDGQATQTITVTAFTGFIP